MGCTDAPTAGTNGTPHIVWSAQGDVAAAEPYADADIAVFTESHTARAVALDANTGRLRWASSIAGGPPGYGLSNSSIVAFGDLIIVGGWNLFAFSRATGELRWSFAPDSEYTVGAPIALADSIVISPGANRRVFAVNARTGQLVWERDLGERPFGAVVANDVAYVGSRGYTSDGGTLQAGRAVALRISDGSLIWAAPLPNNANGFWLGGAGGTGALAPNAFIVASPSGNVYAFDRSTGAKIWQFDGPGPFVSGVGVIGNVAVVASLTGDIFGLDVETGSKRWQRSTGGSSVLDQITADARCAFVPVAELMCLTESGDLRWALGGASRGGPLFMTAAFSRGDRVFVGSLSGFHAISP